VPRRARQISRGPGTRRPQLRVLISSRVRASMSHGRGFGPRPHTHMQISWRKSGSIVFPRWLVCGTILRLASLCVLSPGEVPSASATGILVPAYFSPLSGGSWDALNRAADRVPLIAIMNPNNGPSTSVNPSYTAAVNALRNAGGRVIGYIYSSYSARPLADVEADIDRYQAFYVIDGFFVDEMTNDSDATHLAYYEEL